MDIRNKKITVIGLGNSGLGSALLLEREGAIVSASDSSDRAAVKKNAGILKAKYINVEIGRHTEAFLSGTELMIVSPGIEKTSLAVRYAEANRIPVMSELELGYLFCDAEITAITGTNGKSTVVSLLGEILRCAKTPAIVCGNIGNSLSGEIEKINKKTKVILEVSSFQLERIASFRPKISVILNIADDHLDRHRDFGEYFSVKKKIFENQEKNDFAVLNYDDKNLRALGSSGELRPALFYFSAKKKIRGVYLDKGEVMICLKKRTERIFTLTGTRLEGAHNRENILAAVLVARLLGVGAGKIEKAVKGFIPLAHRFEKVATVGNVDFIDDSKATNPDALRRALESLGRGRCVLIAGGKDKNICYKKALPEVKKKVKKIFLIGETRGKMKKMFGKFVPAEEKSSLEEAVEAAYKHASPGGTVLLSPMSSSFDMFRDYKERGEAFRRAAEKLKRNAIY